MPKLSGVIIAKNEERTVGSVLDALQGLVDEIVFVDSGSTDATIEIAKAAGVRFIHQDWLGYAAQKNFAIDQAEGDWILSLDADEILTPALRDEIKSLLSSPALDANLGYKIPRILYIGDKPVMRGGFYPDAQLRLFKKGAGRFNDRMVHEAVKIDGPLGMLKHPMMHYSYKTVEQFTLAMQRYAELSAQEYKKQGRKGWHISPINEVVHPLWTFIYRYIGRAGFLDGYLGWKLNLIYSDYVRSKIRTLRALYAGSDSIH